MHVVTVFEAYLSGLIFDLLKTEEKLMVKLAQTRKFEAHEIAISYGLQSDVKKYFFEQVSKLTFHNLSEVKPVFRDAIDVRIPLKDLVPKSIETRHQIVHRDGHPKDGVLISVGRDYLSDTLDEFIGVVIEIDRQVVDQYPAIQYD